MLFFALLLQSVPADPDPVAEPAFPRILELAARDCSKGGRDPGRRYRLNVNEARGPDAKDRALRGEWQAWGTTGAPDCPTHSRKILRSD